MGMSTHVAGYRMVDNDWEAKKLAYNACINANIPIPPELYRYFNGENPNSDLNGIEIDITESVSNWNNDYSAGFVVDITKLPKDIRYIKFYNSW